MKQKLSYILAGACSAVLVFVFVLLPLGHIEATTAPTYIFEQFTNPDCGTTCNQAIKCEDECGEHDECCNEGNEEGWSCLYCW